MFSSATITQEAQRGKFPLPNSTQMRQYYLIKAEPQCYPEFSHFFSRSVTSLLWAWRWLGTWDTGWSMWASCPQTLGRERARGGFLPFTPASRLSVGQPWPTSSGHPRPPGVLHPQGHWVSLLWSLPSLHFIPAAPPPTYSFPSGRPLSALLPGWLAFSRCPLSWLYFFPAGVALKRTRPDGSSLSWRFLVFYASVVGLLVLSVTPLLFLLQVTDVLMTAGVIAGVIVEVGLAPASLRCCRSKTEKQ